MKLFSTFLLKQWLFLMLLQFNVAAQTNNTPKTYFCYKTKSTIQLDGKADENEWKKAAWTEAFCDIEGYYKPTPRFETRVKMLWSDTHLYVYAQLNEPDLWATLKQRDAVIFQDNDFEVFIDPDGDRLNYYEFEMNAFNTVWDLLLTKPYNEFGQPISSWDIKNLKTAVSINGTLNNPIDRDSCWTLEIAFPFQAFSESKVALPPKPGDQWRINFSRVEWQTEVHEGNYVKVRNPATGRPYPEDNWVWSPQGAINMHLPSQWGFLVFRDAASSK